MKYLLLLLTLPLQCFGLTADREKPIHIQADNATVDEVTGTSIYRGNVIIEQGTLLINADEVEVRTADSEVIQIIASAETDSTELAHYEQLPDDSEEKVYADARKITYLVQEERLHLTGDARLKQLKDLFTGELLYYDVNQGIVNLNSTGRPGDRIRMTLNPKKNKGN